uniref:heavy metal-associated isoprenylated plant protein 3-like n=1 Tax=Erigeron canadensis TaxID=72917 RepID=UPI001CB94C9D|nr:heavy metal-associated isoprenylated plant protein 3-like [Erigeron canadensis]
MGEKEATQKEATGKKVIIDDANDKQKKVVDEGPISVVLKLDLHCDGCAKKVKKSVRYMQGVESVKADSKSNKLTIIGKVNPIHIKERVEYKTKKKVEIISPKPKKEDTDQGDKKAVDKPATEPKSNDQKPKEPQSTSVVLKIPLHCDGCIQKIKRIILKIDGVESVKPDGNKNLVTVKGTMNTKELVPYLKNKLKRDVDIVVLPAKKEENKDNNVEKKDKTKVEAGENKKDEKKKEGDNEGETKKKNDVAKEAANSVEKKKNDEEKDASGDQSEKDKSSGGGEATSTSIGSSGDDGDGSKNNNVNIVMNNNKLEYYRHDPYTTYTMPQVMYNNQSYHNQDYYGVPVFPSRHYGGGYGNDEGYVGMGYYNGPPPPPSPMSIHNPRPAASENDVFSADNPNACSIM